MPVVVGGKRNVRPVIHAAVDAHDNEVPERLNSRIKQTELELVPIEQVKPNRRNAKKHPDRQIDLLAENYKQFGFTQPIVIDEDGNILCGHARHLAALKLGLTHLPAVRLSQLGAPAKRALAIADNKLAELGEWDVEILAEELGSLFDSETDLSFDPAIVGFETFEVDELLFAEPDTKPKEDPADQFEPPPTTAAITRAGEMWACGGHKLICGSPLQERDYQRLMGEEQAEVVFTDAPPDAPLEEEVEGGRAVLIGVTVLQRLCENVRRHLLPGGMAYFCVDWRHRQEVQAAAAPGFGPMKSLIVWVQPNDRTGGLYRSKHKLILAYTNPGGGPVNNIERGSKRRHRTDVWSYPAFNSPSRGWAEKPVAMVADALMDCSNRGGIVLDPYGGSGTTMIAAERTRRRARLIESEPLHCDSIVQRWQAFSKKTARLADTNETFDEVAARRCTETTRGARS
jgi:hypothetical protein